VLRQAQHALSSSKGGESLKLTAEPGDLAGAGARAGQGGPPWWGRAPASGALALELAFPSARRSNWRASRQFYSAWTCQRRQAYERGARTPRLPATRVHTVAHRATPRRPAPVPTAAAF